MKNKIIGISIFTLVLIAIIGACAAITQIKQEKKCREYTEILGGHTYTGYDSTTTTNHGKVSYHYKLELNKDGTCQIHFKATRTGDNSTFAENGTTEFDITGLNWSVQPDGNGYELFISGDWDWQDWSAGTIDRSIQILDYEGYDLMLKALRSGHYEFHFQKQG